MEPPELEPVAEEAAPDPEPEAEPEPEPEPVAEAPPAVDAKALAAAVKGLRAELPRAALKECKEAVEAAGGDVAAAKAALLEAKGAEWEAIDAAEAAQIAEGLAKAQELADAK